MFLCLYGVTLGLYFEPLLQTQPTYPDPLPEPFSTYPVLSHLEHDVPLLQSLSQGNPPSTAAKFFSLGTERLELGTL